MYTFDEVAEMLDEIMDALPPDVLNELNGGVSLLPEAKHNREIPSDDYYVMGEYTVHHAMGRLIFLYYGSFMALYGDAPPDELKRQLTRTLWHELRHHLEDLAGSRDLEIEDERYVNEALRRLRFRRHL